MIIIINNFYNIRCLLKHRRLFIVVLFIVVIVVLLKVVVVVVVVVLNILPPVRVSNDEVGVHQIRVFDRVAELLQAYLGGRILSLFLLSK
jgi:hypothetical protein